MSKYMTTVYGTIIVAALIAVVMFVTKSTQDFSEQINCLMGTSDSVACPTTIK